MQCAQCHNHPFDRWTMDDYYSWVSFFTGLRRKHGSEAREYYTYVDVDAEPAKHPIDDRLMPHKYLGGEKVSIVDEDARKILAKWMTLPDNRLFRENMANRIWAHFLEKESLNQWMTKDFKSAINSKTHERVGSEIGGGVWL